MLLVKFVPRLARPLRHAPALLLVAALATPLACGSSDEALTPLPLPNVDAGAEPGDAGEDPASGDAAGGDANADASRADAGRDGGGACPVPSGVGPVFRVRAMAANLTSGNLQSYDPGPGLRIMKGVDPDVVMIQEFSYGAEAEAQMVSETFGPGFTFHRGTGAIPNGVISRYPIVASGDWTDPEVSNRSFAWARIDVPGPNDLWAVSVHLLTSSANARNVESKELVRLLDANIPTGDFVVLGGDFNTDSRNEGCFTTLGARFVTGAPHAADRLGNDGTNKNRDKPYDGVYASPCLAALQKATVIGASTFPNGLVADTRVYTPIAEIAPALATDSAATNMQHMGVVKDFFVQP